MEKERTGQATERDQERERLNNQIKVLNQKITQMQRLFEKQLGAKPSTSSRAPDKSSMEPPTANIKPMAGSSSSPRKEKQTTVSVSISLFNLESSDLQILRLCTFVQRVPSVRVGGPETRLRLPAFGRPFRCKHEP